ncbi:MAG: tetratricopeptide repeat protein, partial [Halofilum sp. (in: g-proteobacteria)]|nr:tetratricopeptide repeat protein [Halofilum sp. (in: g-proteobacteria)]
DEAITQFRRAVTSAPDSPDLRFHLARAFHANGQTEKAREAVKRALASDARFAEREQAETFLRELE